MQCAGLLKWLKAHAHYNQMSASNQPATESGWSRIATLESFLRFSVWTKYLRMQTVELPSSPRCRWSLPSSVRAEEGASLGADERASPSRPHPHSNCLRAMVHGGSWRQTPCDLWGQRRGLHENSQTGWVQVNGQSLHISKAWQTHCLLELLLEFHQPLLHVSFDLLRDSAAKGINSQPPVSSGLQLWQVTACSHSLDASGWLNCLFSLRASGVLSLTLRLACFYPAPTYQPHVWNIQMSWTY